MVSADVTFQVYAESVEGFIDRMIETMSPTRIEEFLAGPANEWFVKRAEDRFASEGDDASGPWPALSDATNDIREFLGYPPVNPINVRDGELRAWAVAPGRPTSDEGAVGMEWPGADPTSQEMQMKIDHAQQGGTSDWGTGFPARPVIAFNATDVAGVAVSFARWFAEVTSL